MAERDIFGRMADGRAVERVTLTGGGLTARLLCYGGALQDLRLEGHAPPLVLGFETFGDYLAHSPYFGATVGRCANRIANAAFSLDGSEYRVDPNFLRRHHLHGGRAGIGTRLWTLAEHSATAAEFTIDLSDGDMGYPGAMRASVRYTLAPGGVLDIRMTARADAPTLCNLAHHSYFNLSGEADMLGHRLSVDAAHYLPVDADLIPTGEVAPVVSTPLDFRRGALMRDACAAMGIDHNLCLSRERQAIREVATLSAGAVTMTIRTTEPGLQVYDAARLDIPVPGLEGRRMAAHAGLALEPQVWPDAIHHPDWAQPVLRPGETYVQHTQFVFAKAAA